MAGRAKHKSPLRTPIQGSISQAAGISVTTGAMGDPQSKHMSSPLTSRQSSTSSNHSNGSNVASTSTNQKPSPFSSISALRDAFSAGELRSYGSPVMTLKETIDKIQWSGDFVSNRAELSSREEVRNSQGSDSNQDFVDYGDGSGGPDSPDPGPAYSQVCATPHSRTPPPQNDPRWAYNHIYVACMPPPPSPPPPRNSQYPRPTCNQASTPPPPPPKQSRSQERI